MESFNIIKKKMIKNLGQDDVLKCLPLLWNQLSKVKSRVEQVVGALTNKNVQREKVLEFKKQLVSNKNLKEYFKSNPSERDILMNDIQRAYSKKSDRFLFKSLEILPEYVLPEALIATTPE